MNIDSDPDEDIRSSLLQLEYGTKISILGGDYLLANASTGLPLSGSLKLWRLSPSLLQSSHRPSSWDYRILSQVKHIGYKALHYGNIGGLDRHLVEANFKCFWNQFTSFLGVKWTQRPKTLVQINVMFLMKSFRL